MVDVPAPRGPFRRLIAELPLELVIAGVGLGLIVIADHHFRVGSVLIACSIIAGAGLRLMLPARRAGLLAVRGRLVDVVTLAVLGAALLALALAVPYVR